MLRLQHLAAQICSNTSQQALEAATVRPSADQSTLQALCLCLLDTDAIARVIILQAELRRKRAQVLNLHKQKEQWKAEEKYAHGLNQQLWGAVTMLEGKLQELQQNTTLVEQPPAVVDVSHCH